MKKITDIDCINALENGTMLIWFADGTKVETTSVDFCDDGTLEFGYIYT